VQSPPGYAAALGSLDPFSLSLSAPHNTIAPPPASAACCCRLTPAAPGPVPLGPAPPLSRHSRTRALSSAAAGSSSPALRRPARSGRTGSAAPSWGYRSEPPALADWRAGAPLETIRSSIVIAPIPPSSSTLSATSATSATRASHPEPLHNPTLSVLLKADLAAPLALPPASSALAVLLVSLHLHTYPAAPGAVNIAAQDAQGRGPLLEGGLPCTYPP
jgi:hypothetical protein